MQVPDLKNLKKLVDFCRKQGVSQLKSGDFEISLSPSALFPSKPAKHAPSETIPTEGSFSEEDALFWSSAGIPENMGEQ